MKYSIRITIIAMLIVGIFSHFEIVFSQTLTFKGTLNPHSCWNSQCQGHPSVSYQDHYCKIFSILTLENSQKGIQVLHCVPKANIVGFPSLAKYMYQEVVIEGSVQSLPVYGSYGKNLECIKNPEACRHVEELLIMEKIKLKDQDDSEFQNMQVNKAEK